LYNRLNLDHDAEKVMSSMVPRQHATVIDAIGRGGWASDESNVRK
jgi:hypothetical protein